MLICKDYFNENEKFNDIYTQFCRVLWGGQYLSVHRDFVARQLGDTFYDE
jgi:hypothetical protein